MAESSAVKELPLQDALDSLQELSKLEPWPLTDIKWREYLTGVAAGCGICLLAYCVKHMLKNWASSPKTEPDIRGRSFLVNGDGARSRLNSSRSRRLRGSELGLADQRSAGLPGSSLRFSETSFASEERLEPLTNANGVSLEEESNYGALSSAQVDSITDDFSCDTEVRKQEGQHLMTLLFHIGEDQSKRESVRHNGFSCNVCEANPLTGVRYKCANCNDFDVCERCEVSCDHDPTHVFIKIKTPIPPLAFPRSVLLPKFYPGKVGLHKPLSWQEVLDLKDQTYFETSDIECLHEKYASLSNDPRGISREVYYKCLGPLGTQKNLVLDQIFKFYDSDSDGYIDFAEFVVGISIVSRGTHEEKLRHVFSGYDVDKDGLISKNELYRMLNAYYHINVELLKDVIKSCEESLMTNYENLADKPISSIFKAPIPVDGGGAVPESDCGSKGKSSAVQPHPPEDDRTAWWADLSPIAKESFHSFPVVEAMVKDAIKEMVTGIMQDADANGDDQLSFEEFADYVAVDVSLLNWFEEFAGVF